MLLVYMDGIIVTGDDDVEIKQLNKDLAAKFEIKDLGEQRYFLDIEVTQSGNGICICQRKYALDLLTEIGKVRCKPATTPNELNHGLSKTGRRTLT